MRKPAYPGIPGPRGEETTPDCASRSTCGRKGAKATRSSPRARSIAARADRSRGLFRRAKAMASSSPKVVGTASGMLLADGSGNRWLGSPGLATVSAGLTFRLGEIRTRDATPASVTSGGLGKGRRRKAHPGTSSRAISTSTQPDRCDAATMNVGRRGTAFRAIQSPPLARTARCRNEVPVVGVILHGSDDLILSALSARSTQTFSRPFGRQGDASCIACRAAPPLGPRRSGTPRPATTDVSWAPSAQPVRCPPSRSLVLRTARSN